MGHDVIDAVLESADGVAVGVEITRTPILSVEIILRLKRVIAVHRDYELNSVLRGR